MFQYTYTTSQITYENKFFTQFFGGIQQLALNKHYKIPLNVNPLDGNKSCIYI